MCKCFDKKVYETDEQPLFCIFYCLRHETYQDGFGTSLEPTGIIQEETFLQ
jgi:hypothetical protein